MQNESYLYDKCSVKRRILKDLDLPEELETKFTLGELNRIFGNRCQRKAQAQYNDFVTKLMEETDDASIGKNK